MSQDESPETVFISGATSGLGLAVAEHFVKIGKAVIFCARGEASVEATEKHLKSLASKNQTILGFSNDVSNRDTTIKVFEKLQELDIHIDILICNAGLIGPIDRFLENNLEDWELAFNVNFYGTMNLVMQVLPSMILANPKSVNFR